MARVALICGLVVSAAIALLVACAPRPTWDRAKLKAIRSEAQSIMVRQPAGAAATVPKAQWPRTIAALQPDRVAVYSDGVEITTKAWFDGGWGYFIRTPQTRPEPEGRYSSAGEGIYWYHPY